MESDPSFFFFPTDVHLLKFFAERGDEAISDIKKLTWFSSKKCLSKTLQTVHDGKPVIWNKTVEHLWVTLDPFPRSWECPKGKKKKKIVFPFLNELTLVGFLMWVERVSFYIIHMLVLLYCVVFMFFLTCIKYYYVFEWSVLARLAVARSFTLEFSHLVSKWDLSKFT